MTVYTTEEVAARFRVNVRTVRRMIRAGKLKAVRVGKEYRIEESEIERITEGGVK